MKKYFSYDALEREFTTHDTLEEAKSQAQDYVDQTFEFGANDGFDTDLEDAIKEGCFGVVLGGFDLPTRPLTEEEKELYADEFTHMVENPVLVEYPQNEWIKCSERLPNIYDHNGYLRSDIVICYGKENSDDEMNYFFAFLRSNGFFNNYDRDCYLVTHWQPLPNPPSD